ncbi:hypothetical protein EDD21DRAFT_388703 [Dissophora ornata]|nr:hypothetical protein EDD21DRAFT_388703 [Dissophora ornata]
MMKERESFQLFYEYPLPDPYSSGHATDFPTAEEGGYPGTLQRALVAATTRSSKSTFSLRDETNQQPHIPQSRSLSASLQDGAQTLCSKALMMQGSTFSVTLHVESSRLTTNAERSNSSSLEESPHRSRNSLQLNSPSPRAKESMADESPSTDRATNDSSLQHSTETRAHDLREDAQENILASKAEVPSSMLISDIHIDSLRPHQGSPPLINPRLRRDDRTRGVLPHISTTPPPGPWRHMPRHSPRVHHDHLHCHVRYESEGQRSPLSSRPGYLSYCGAITDHPLRVATRTSPSLSHSEFGSASSISSIPRSPGHEIQPIVDPGHILGVHRPLRTQRHAFYDVPLYGIENFEFSSSRYSMSTMSHSEGGHGGIGDVTGAGAGGSQLAGSTAATLSKHREHIWAIAHEEEYGPASSMDDGSSGQALHQGRYKRLQRWVPMQPPMTSNSVSVSGHWSKSGSGSDLRGPLVGHPPSPLSHEIGSVAGSPSENSHQRQPRPVSQGVYGPDSFMDSLENPKRTCPKVGGQRRCEVMVSKHRKNCLCFWLLVAVAAVVPLIVLHKKSSASSASAEASSVGSEVTLGGEGGGSSTKEIRGRTATTHKQGVAPGTVSKTETASTPPTRSATKSKTDSPAQPRQTTQVVTRLEAQAPRQTTTPPSGY